MNNICPFCNNTSVVETWLSDNQFGYENTSFRCSFEGCKKWLIYFSEDVIYFYIIKVIYNNKEYKIIGQANETSIYYDGPDYGALSPVPLVVIPRLLPLEEPYLECVQKYLNKFLILIVYI